MIRIASAFQQVIRFLNHVVTLSDSSAFAKFSRMAVATNIHHLVALDIKRFLSESGNICRLDNIESARRIACRIEDTKSSGGW